MTVLCMVSAWTFIVAFVVAVVFVALFGIAPCVAAARADKRMDQWRR